MNDLVFVMCNLKLNDNQVKKQANDFGEFFDHLSSDDDWITEGEKRDGSSNFDLLGVIDSATRRKNGKEDESDDEENLNDVGMECHGTEDDLEIQNDVNPDNSRSLELNIVDNIGVGPGTSSSTNVSNIGTGTSSSTNVPLDGNDFDDCFRNNEGDKDNEGVFSLHDTPTNCLF
uniref:Uncharacterized protein n=1 Tax=Populus trichocarpa TaxID=3694 RepID=A0A3N7ET70_POPTR